MKAEIIFGPPGTGKTRTLVDIARGKRALFLSYTKAAALEAGGRVDGDITCSTIHSLSFQALGLTRQSVVTPKKLAEFGEVAGIPFRGSDGSEQEEEGDEYLSAYSFARNLMIPESQAYDQFGRPGTPLRFKMCVNAYEDWKRTYGYSDFDDMLTQASKQGFADVPPNVILDEAQDCTPLQWSVFENICKAGAQQVYIAGDDDQAIYEWNGADPHGMINFSQRHGARSRVLGQSHRVPVSVYEYVHEVILEEMAKRTKKVFRPRAEPGFIRRWGDFERLPAQLFQRERISKDATFLILTRDNYRLRELQQALHEKRLPYNMATTNGPYENRFARAIRGWTRDGEPTEDECDAMRALGSSETQELVKQKKWKELRTFSWRTELSIPPHMIDFYEHADLFTPPYIKLSTIHQAKGGEADVVIVDLSMTPRVEHGVDLNRDAELRVMYVGLTRTKRELHLLGENVLI